MVCSTAFMNAVKCFDRVELKHHLDFLDYRRDIFQKEALRGANEYYHAAKMGLKNLSQFRSPRVPEFVEQNLIIDLGRFYYADRRKAQRFPIIREKRTLILAIFILWSRPYSRP